MKPSKSGVRVDVPLIGRGFDFRPRNYLEPVVHTHVPPSASRKVGTSEGTVMPCGWEGNRRRHTGHASHRFIRLRAHGLGKGGKHPAYTPHTFPYLYTFWLGSRVVSVLDSGAEGPRFKSQLRRCRATVLGKLFTPIVPLFTKQQNW